VHDVQVLLQASHAAVGRQTAVSRKPGAGDKHGGLRMQQLGHHLLDQPVGRCKKNPRKKEERKERGKEESELLKKEGEMRSALKNGSRQQQQAAAGSSRHCHRNPLNVWMVGSLGSTQREDDYFSGEGADHACGSWGLCGSGGAHYAA
jgi:hypothetical protein